MNTYKDIEAEEEMYDEEQDEKEPLDPFVLEILLQIFRKVFNVNHFFSKEELQLTPEHFIEKIMNNEMKDITKEDSLTIMERKTAINNESFNQIIKKDLKYILSHYSKSVIAPNRNNKYRYLICFSLLESMYDSTNELPNKTIKELQIFLLNGFLDKKLSTEEALIRMALFIGNFCGNAYYDQLKKEFEVFFNNY